MVKWFKYHLRKLCCLSALHHSIIFKKEMGNAVIQVCVWNHSPDALACVSIFATRHYCIHYYSFIVVLISGLSLNICSRQECTDCTWSLQFTCQFSKSPLNKLFLDFNMYWTFFILLQIPTKLLGTSWLSLKKIAIILPTTEILRTFY